MNNRGGVETKTVDTCPVIMDGGWLPLRPSLCTAEPHETKLLLKRRINSLASTPPFHPPSLPQSPHLLSLLLLLVTAASTSGKVFSLVLLRSRIKPNFLLPGWNSDFHSLFLGQLALCLATIRVTSHLTHSWHGTAPHWDFYTHKHCKK